MIIRGLTAAAAIIAVAASVQAQSRIGTRGNIEDAVQAALRETDGGRVSEVALDSKDGRDVWEVEIIRDGRETEVQVDATTGSVVEVERKGKVSSRKQRRLQETRIPMSQALDAALAHSGGGTVRKIEIDQEDGQPTYEFDIEVNGRKEEVDIDVVTGEVVPQSWGLFSWLNPDRRSTPRRSDRTQSRDYYGYRGEYRSDGRQGRYGTQRYYYDNDHYRRDDDRYWAD